MSRINAQTAVALVASLLVITQVGCTDEDLEGNGANANQYDEDVVDDTDDNGDNHDNGDANDNTDTNDNGDNDDPFDVDPVECAHPADDDPDCPDGEFGPASFFSHFEISDGDCCFDLTGNGHNDNFIGEDVVPAIESGLDGFGDVNDNINSSIEFGELAYLLEAAHWDHPEWDDDMELYVHLGGETNDDMSTVLAGDGAYEVAEENFDADGNRRFAFDDVTVRDGVLEASGGTVAVMFPGLVEGLVLTLKDVHLEGEIVQSPEPELQSGGNFAISDGQMGGALMRDDFYKSMNEIAHTCDCIEDDYEDPDNPDPWSEGVFRYREDNDSWSCLQGKVTGDACSEPGTPPRCQTLGEEEFCTILGPFSSSSFTDVEVDGELGYSVGLHFESVTTEITGIE